jgi:hypothetical protein
MFVEGADLFCQMGSETPIENTPLLNQFGKRILSDYEYHRNWVLSELVQCRARGRNGLYVKTERKALQRELAKLRRIT